ncbi:unnamed protein product [Blepharisma stoltei]|uniref:Uncharacterized protein n=1 Tax=Blepharisma stoltei TaxID=1481888 RepID=A0AAU9J8X9_9CILI|nr:unnamed protein product [Blepharisma stoltei]
MHKNKMKNIPTNEKFINAVLGTYEPAPERLKTPDFTPSHRTDFRQKFRASWNANSEIQDENMENLLQKENEIRIKAKFVLSLNPIELSPNRYKTSKLNHFSDALKFKRSPFDSKKKIGKDKRVQNKNADQFHLPSLKKIVSYNALAKLDSMDQLELQKLLVTRKQRRSVC